MTPRCELGEAPESLGAGFLREGGVVRGAKDWGPEGSHLGGPGGERGSLVCPGECPQPPLSSTIPKDGLPGLQANGQQVGWTCFSQMRTPGPEPQVMGGGARTIKEASREDSPSLAAPQAGALGPGAQVPTLTSETWLSHGCGLATEPAGAFGAPQLSWTRLQSGSGWFKPQTHSVALDPSSGAPHPVSRASFSSPSHPDSPPPPREVSACLLPLHTWHLPYSP